jgi:hypothetical protein
MPEYGIYFDLPSVVLLNVIMLSVVAPLDWVQKLDRLEIKKTDWTRKTNWSQTFLVKSTILKKFFLSFLFFQTIDIEQQWEKEASKSKQRWLMTNLFDLKGHAHIRNSPKINYVLPLH